MGGTEENTGAATRGATTEEGGGEVPRLDTSTHLMRHMEVHNNPISEHWFGEYAMCMYNHVYTGMHISGLKLPMYIIKSVFIQL
jgi:hypothetical protein